MKEGRRRRVTENSRPAGQNIHDRDRGTGGSRGAGREQAPNGDKPGDGLGILIGQKRQRRLPDKGGRC